MKAEHKAFVDNMTKAGQLAANTLRYIASYVKEGVTTLELDHLMEDYIKTNGGRSACRGYFGYPAATCISVNEVACHGVPDSRKLESGDLLNIDVTVDLNGYFGDTSKMFLIQPLKDMTNVFKINDILDSTSDAILKGMEQCKPGIHVGDLGFAMNKSITRSGYYTTNIVGGHGIGTFFHGEPYVPFSGKKGRGAILQPWTCITIEPVLLSINKELISVPIPGSTITKLMAPDNCLNAQLEHTVLITDTGYEVLTL